MLQGLGIWDWAALAAYFAVLLGVAWWVVLQKNKSSRDYFLAGKNAGWFVIGASLFASNIGSEHLVGLAGTGARDGMAMAHYELHAWCLLVLGWLMVPFYTASARTALLRRRPLVPFDLFAHFIRLHKDFGHPFRRRDRL